jgi:DNA invertase Pin-like site-specific DNA recombinase
MTETHSRERLIGYAHVSTFGQTLDSQLQQGFARPDAAPEYPQGEGDGSAARPARASRGCWTRLAPGDVATVTRIDRLAHQHLRPVRHRQAHRPREGARFRSLAESRADTWTSTGRLMAAVLGGRADVELDLIRTRTAKDKGFSHS